MGFLHYLYLQLQVFYRVSKDLLGYSREQVQWLMSLHEGEWLGDNGELIYVILNSQSPMDAHNGFQMFSKTISFSKKVTKAVKRLRYRTCRIKRSKWLKRNKRWN